MAVSRLTAWIRPQPATVLPPGAAAGTALTRLKPGYSQDCLISPVGADLSLRVVGADDPSVRSAKISLPDTFTNAFAQKVPAGGDR